MVRRGDEVVALTRIEYELLLFLAERPRRVFTRLQLLSNVWGYEHAVARTVDVHVRRLRAKLPGAEVITTVYGVGYRLGDEARISVDAATEPGGDPRIGSSGRLCCNHLASHAERALGSDVFVNCHIHATQPPLDPRAGAGKHR
ncbi:hypothetical protein GCM10027614_14820 [Micromonospora vulcania]